MAKKSFFRRHSRATVLSVAFHLALVAALTISVRWAREPSAPVAAAESVAIEATVVDESIIERELARLEQQEQAEILQRQEEERIAREQAEAAQREREEQQRQLEAARVEQERREQEAQAEQARLAELQRQREEEERLRQEAEQQRLEEERRIAEQRAEEERQRREEEERRQREERERLAREAEEARQRAEMEAQMLAAMAAEDERRRAEQAGLLDQYVLLIENRIERAWIRPASATAGLRCEVAVTQIPSGDVIDVQVRSCNGDDAVVRSIEAAVLRASPLPQPPIPELFDRNLIVNFQPDDQ
jgi:colicin import membrane protein